jgi:hypothetical protein
MKYSREKIVIAAWIVSGRKSMDLLQMTKLPVEGQTRQINKDNKHLETAIKVLAHQINRNRIG